MKSPAVQELAQEMWDAREAGALPPAWAMDRRMAEAIAADVKGHLEYVPMEDRRVEWLRELIRQRNLLKPQYRPEVPELDHLMAWMLDREEVREASGKDRAAGEREEILTANGR